MAEKKTYEQLEAELVELRFQLEEANDAIHAIRTGQVDSLIIKAEAGHQIYTLKSADQTYRVFIEKMKEGAVTLNEDGIILYCNSQFAKLIGQHLNVVIGKSFTEFVNEASVEDFNNYFKKGWESDSKGELVLKHDHDVITVLVSLSTMELESGMALSMIVTDLSSQKAVEIELKRKNEQLEEARSKAALMNEELEFLVHERTKDLTISREHFKFLADNIPVIVWTSNADGQGEYFNKRWEEYTGYSAVDSKGHGRDIIHPDDYENSVKLWREAVEKVEKYECELRFKRKSDGEYRWHHAHAIPFRAEDGRVLGWLGTHIDIDDQKQELDKKDEFIGVASHELKTPLTSLKGYVQLVEQHQDLPGPVSQYIKKAIESITKLQHLINDLLDVSRIQAGKLKFSTEEVNLSELINASIENSKYIYDKYSIKKEVEPGILVEGNTERLEQVLMNLINNAVKYSPDHNEIIIRAVKEGSQAVVSVIDKGIGLSESNQKRIFERFYRVEDMPFRSSGLGMGLYIASEIVNEHKGEMKVNSRIGQGSAFTFCLPLKTA